MIIDNVYVFTSDKAFVKGGIILDGDKIRQVYEEKDAPQLNGDVLDGKGCYAIPGLIDLHFHGCKGDDFCDGDKAAIGRIAEYEASVGYSDCTGYYDFTGRGTGADPPYSCRI